MDTEALLNEAIQKCNEIMFQQEYPLGDEEIITFRFNDSTIRFSLKGDKLTYELSDDRVFVIDEDSGIYSSLGYVSLED